MMSRPNFFIAGAPKSGTTSLYKYLRSHPRIFMPHAKEPHYFAEDFVNYPAVREEADYLKLFKKSTDVHLAIGEASVWYLYSKVALDLIRDFNPDARIIVMLRNPVDLAYAMHGQALYNFNENEPDFEKAWLLQNERARGKHIPKGCRAEQILQYQKLASLGHQVEHLLNVFPHRQVSILFFEEFIADPAGTYRKTLDFLGVPDDGRNDFPKSNESKIHKSNLLGWLTQTPPPAIININRFLREKLGISTARPLSILRRLNDKPLQRGTLPTDLRHTLIEVFRPDVDLLSDILGTELCDWLENGKNPYA